MIKMQMPNGQFAYKSFSGNYYQYDLTNPVDKQKYDLDLEAQMRDKLSTNPYRLSENGGGIYENV